MRTPVNQTYAADNKTRAWKLIRRLVRKPDAPGETPLTQAPAVVTGKAEVLSRLPKSTKRQSARNPKGTPTVGSCVIDERHACDAEELAAAHDLG